MVFEKIIASIETKARETIGKNTSDYIGEDGLLMCGNCDTKKQCVVEFMGKKRTPYCLCKCEQERLNAEKAELEKRDRMQKIGKLRNMGFLDEEMKKWTFENDDQPDSKYSKIARRYVDNFPKMLEKSKGLLFFGNVGSGKTYLAACIANALIDKGNPCLVTNFSRIVNTIGGTYDNKQKYIDGLNKFDLLVIDDLAAERDTEYVNEIIYSVIDSRYRSGKPLIVTTNLRIEEIKNSPDVKKQRILSRLTEMCLFIPVNGKDRRKAKYNEDRKELQEILGLGESL